jgi:negative regulator of flagellin synthesis FlgM
MKIEGSLHFIDPSHRVQKEETSTDHQNARVPSTQQVEDRLEFSTSIREFQQLDKKAREAPEIRADRVAEIERELNSGTYNIKAEKVAEAMITGAIVNRRA